eukprot:GILK01000849.1.p1 GENE.GILK01000849.1~~GILK01000849.1.p1  ORF type:complete len:240 (+),score=36.32 GILK01000849.1:64-720(+)
MAKAVVVVVVCLVLLVVNVEAGAFKNRQTEESDSSKTNRRSYQETAEKSVKTFKFNALSAEERLQMWLSGVLMTGDKAKSLAVDSSFPGAQKKEVQFDTDLATCLVLGNEDDEVCNAIGQTDKPGKKPKCTPCLDGTKHFASALCVPTKLTKYIDCTSLRQHLSQRQQQEDPFWHITETAETRKYPGEVGSANPYEELLVVYDSLRRAGVMQDLRIKA